MLYLVKIMQFLVKMKAKNILQVSLVVKYLRVRQMVMVRDLNKRTLKEHFLDYHFITFSI